MRRAGRTVAGQLVALALLAPYLVMLLTALKPEAELRTSPPRLLPSDWQPGNFVTDCLIGSTEHGGDPTIL